MPWKQVFAKFQEGRLRSGSGQKVTNRKQAIAIAMSEKRQASAGKKEYQSNPRPHVAMGKMKLADYKRVRAAQQARGKR